MQTKSWSIALMVVTTLFTSFAQVMYKFASDKLSLNLLNIITNYYLIAGLILYFIGAILMITAFKGGEVSVLYPIIATSYIWVSLLSFYFFQETINLFRWLGVLAIIIGIIFVSLGSKETAKYPEAL